MAVCCSQTIKDINTKFFLVRSIRYQRLGYFVVDVAVAGFMISGLLILILERTNIRHFEIHQCHQAGQLIFLYHSFFLIGKGMFWGNVLGLGICALQYFTNIIPLDPEAYYIATVPIAFNWSLIIALNIGTLLASMLMMVGPSYLITKILPAKIIRYE